MELIIIIIIIVFVFYLYGKSNETGNDYSVSNDSKPHRKIDIDRSSSIPKPYKSYSEKKYTKHKKYPDNTYGLIQRCIDEGEDIKFTYKREDGQISSRVVTPEVIYWGNSQSLNAGKTVRTCYIEGFCHLRNDDRTFIIDRMSNVRKI